MAGQNLLANTTLFNLNSSNPLYNFVSQIRVKNGSNSRNTSSIDMANVTSAILSSNERSTKDNGSILAPAVRPLINDVVQKLLQSASPILKLAPGSPLPKMVKMATNNVMSSLDSGFLVFMQTVTKDVVHGTWKDFVESVQGNQTGTPGTTPGSPSRPSVTPSTTMPAALPPNIFQSGFDSFTAAAGSAAIAMASGLAQPAGLEPLPGTITGEALPQLINSTFTPAVYNLVKKIAASVINSALDEFVSVLNPNNTDPRAVAIRKSTAASSTTLRAMVNGDVNSMVNSSFDAFSVSEFYSIHLSQYCYGRYMPEAPLRQIGDIEDSTQNNRTLDTSTRIGQMRWKKEVIGCSSLGDMKDFDFSVPLQRAFDRQNVGVVLPPIKLPSVVRDNVPKLQIITTLVYTMQIMGVVFASSAFIMCAIVFCWVPEKEASTRMLEMSSVVVLSTATAGLLTVTILTTVVVIGLKTVMGQIGDTLTINAQSGRLFLALTWTASVLLVLASASWGLFLFLRRRDRGSKTEELTVSLKEELLLQDNSSYPSRSSNAIPPRPQYGPYMRRPSLAQIYQARSERNRDV